MSYNRSVIIVDDSESDRMLFTKYLQQIGFNCTSYENAEQLLEKFHHHEPGFILMDIELPGISGIDAVKILKEKQNDSTNKHVIIALTSHNGSSFTTSLAGHGFDDYLQKPVTKKEMQNRLNNYFSEYNNDECIPDSCQESGDNSGKLYSLEMLDAEDPVFLHSIVEMFVNDTPLSIQAIRNAYESDNMTDLKFTAHKLKPHFGFFGALKVQQMMQKIEDIGRGLENKEKLPELISRVEQCSALIIAQLKEDILK